MNTVLALYALPASFLIQLRAIKPTTGVTCVLLPGGKPASPKDLGAKQTETQTPTMKGTKISFNHPEPLTLEAQSKQIIQQCVKAMTQGK